MLVRCRALRALQLEHQLLLHRLASCCALQAERPDRTAAWNVTHNTLLPRVTTSTGTVCWAVNVYSTVTSNSSRALPSTCRMFTERSNRFLLSACLADQDPNSWEVRISQHADFLLHHDVSKPNSGQFEPDARYCAVLRPAGPDRPPLDRPAAALGKDGQPIGECDKVRYRQPAGLSLLLFGCENCENRLGRPCTTDIHSLENLSRPHSGGHGPGAVGRDGAQSQSRPRRASQAGARAKHRHTPAGSCSSHGVRPDADDGDRGEMKDDDDGTAETTAASPLSWSAVAALGKELLGLGNGDTGVGGGADAHHDKDGGRPGAPLRAMDVPRQTLLEIDQRVARVPGSNVPVRSLLVALPRVHPDQGMVRSVWCPRNPRGSITRTGMSPRPPMKHGQAHQFVFASQPAVPTSLRPSSSPLASVAHAAQPCPLILAPPGQHNLRGNTGAAPHSTSSTAPAAAIAGCVASSLAPPASSDATLSPHLAPRPHSTQQTEATRTAVSGQQQAADGVTWTPQPRSSSPAGPPQEHAHQQMDSLPRPVPSPPLEPRLPIHSDQPGPLPSTSDPVAVGGPVGVQQVATTTAAEPHDHSLAQAFETSSNRIEPYRAGDDQKHQLSFLTLEPSSGSRSRLGSQGSIGRGSSKLRPRVPWQQQVQQVVVSRGGEDSHNSAQQMPPPPSQSHQPASLASLALRRQMLRSNAAGHGQGGGGSHRLSRSRSGSFDQVHITKGWDSVGNRGSCADSHQSAGEPVTHANTTTSKVDAARVGDFTGLADEAGSEGPHYAKGSPPAPPHSRHRSCSVESVGSTVSMMAAPTTPITSGLPFAFSAQSTSSSALPSALAVANSSGGNDVSTSMATPSATGATSASLPASDTSNTTRKIAAQVLAPVASSPSACMDRGEEVIRAPPGDRCPDSAKLHSLPARSSRVPAATPAHVIADLIPLAARALSGEPHLADATTTMLSSRLPHWSAATAGLSLRFLGGRTRIADCSARNFLIDRPQEDADLRRGNGSIAASSPSTSKTSPIPCLQFGKRGPSRFSLDFRYPLCPLQAFGIFMASFVWIAEGEDDDEEEEAEGEMQKEAASTGQTAGSSEISSKATQQNTSSVASLRINATTGQTTASASSAGTAQPASSPTGSDESLLDRSGDKWVGWLEWSGGETPMPGPGFEGDDMAQEVNGSAAAVTMPMSTFLAETATDLSTSGLRNHQPVEESDRTANAVQQSPRRMEAPHGQPVNESVTINIGAIV